MIKVNITLFICGILLGSTVSGLIISGYYTHREDEAEIARLQESAKHYAQVRAHEEAQLVLVENVETQRREYEKIQTSLFTENQRLLELLSSRNRDVSSDVSSRLCSESGSPGMSQAGSSTIAQKSPPETRLSEAFARDIAERARLADEAAIYARTCYEWIRGLP